MNSVLPIANRGHRIAWLSPSDLALYRGATLGLLRFYFRLSVEIGRLPSLLGRECFRARLTSYRAQSFEDAVIFVHDLERCLEELDDFAKKLVVRIVFQEYTQEEAAGLLGCTCRTVERRFPETLDLLSVILLERGFIPFLPLHLPPEPAPGKSCQEGRKVEICGTSSNQRK
jgi:sigma-70-like protein